MAAKPVMVRVAFFKGKGSLADRLLRLLGFGPYTRVEVVVGRRLKTGWHCYAPRESGPMRQLIDLKPEDWDIVDVRGVSRASALRWYKQREERPCRLRDLGFRVLRCKAGRGTAESAADFLQIRDLESCTPSRLHCDLTFDL